MKPHSPLTMTQNSDMYNHYPVVGTNKYTRRYMPDADYYYVSLQCLLFPLYTQRFLSSSEVDTRQNHLWFSTPTLLLLQPYSNSCTIQILGPCYTILASK